MLGALRNGCDVWIFFILHYMYFILVLFNVKCWYVGTSGVNLFFRCFLLHFVASTFWLESRL